LFWEEAAIAAGSSLVMFVVFATQAAMRVGRFDRFPGALRRLFASASTAAGRKRRWIVATSLFAAVGQSPVLVVALYRGEHLGFASRLLLGGEVVVAVVWMLLLLRWVRRPRRGDPSVSQTAPTSPGVAP
jgi:hypothetical protein